MLKLLILLILNNLLLPYSLFSLSLSHLPFLLGTLYLKACFQLIYAHIYIYIYSQVSLYIFMSSLVCVSSSLWKLSSPNVCNTSLISFQPIYRENEGHWMANISYCFYCYWDLCKAEYVIRRQTVAEKKLSRVTEFFTFNLASVIYMWEFGSFIYFLFFLLSISVVLFIYLFLKFTIYFILFFSNYNFILFLNFTKLY